ncbi:hypothetical protein BGZ57DRAFT_629433 [Hyaloscypha finlandica]|nr:hypothetical protein BGZ57DRAFT_629433 [Hyaloscypha finlandica]
MPCKSTGKASEGCRGRAALDKSKDNLHVALIAALLILVFESMNGNTKAAVKNVRSALGVINNTLKCQSHFPFSKHECIRLRVFPVHQWETRLPDPISLPEGVSAPAMLVLEIFSETALPECVPDICIQLEQWRRAFSKLLQFSRHRKGLPLM